eukprot:358229-Chlamydomonas_euryale.AAC.18
MQGMVRVRVRVNGSRPTRSVLVLSVARQRGTSSGLGAVAKGKPFRMVLSQHKTTPPTGRENGAQSR